MSFIQIPWRNDVVSIEYEWIGCADSKEPLLVFLHEGLGSVSMWRNYPSVLCQELGFRGLVYSRPAYGKSTPKPQHVFWNNDFLHQQALEVFPEVLRGLGIQEPVHILGHSDGGSIALLIAAHLPELVKAIVVIAPHIFVEDLTINSIEQAKVQYLGGALKNALAKYHDDVDSAFWGWNDVWLNPEFRKFDITSELERISCPLLCIQGTLDPYGTMAQVNDIAKFAKQAQIVEIPDCGHSVHRDSPIMLSNVVQNFLK